MQKNKNFNIFPDNINTPTISSTEGHWGTWGEIFKCRPGGYIHGFSLRVEQPFLIPDDETATNNFRFYCNNDEPDVFLEGDGINRFGQWRSIKKCARSEALCALQTQVQRDQGLGKVHFLYMNCRLSLHNNFKVLKKFLKILVPVKISSFNCLLKEKNLP